jgi:uncharacterized membrane protein YhaH (DUF805 family)
MSDWRKIYWQLFNTVGRIVGVCFALVGGIFALWGLSLILDSKTTMDVNGVPSSDPWIKAIVLIVGLVVCVLGVLTLVAKRYRP